MGLAALWFNVFRQIDRVMQVKVKHGAAIDDLKARVTKLEASQDLLPS